MAVAIAGNIVRIVSRVSPIILKNIKHSTSVFSPACVKCLPRPGVYEVSHRYLCTETPIAEKTQVVSPYKERPWDYLESEEYIERYGARPVWSDYRRNHKGSIPPQKTRKTCIRGDKICGNPCPVCRDPHLIIHYQNVKLLQQFIQPYSGEVYDPTRTGVCMKQQKVLKKAVDTARDYGLLPFHVPFVDYSDEDFSTSHDAVGCTPPRSDLSSGQPWYTWYAAEADEEEVAKVKKIYKAYLK